MLRALGHRARIAAYEWQYRARIGLTSFRWGGRSPVIDQIREVWNNRKMELTPIAAYQLFVTAQSTRKLAGVMAEVGVFQGASAKLICEAVPDKPLHLFDTFEGLPRTAPIDGDFRQGQYACSLEDVQKYLGDSEGLYYYKGLFPFTAAPIESTRFCFVHLDVDLYRSTIDALKFFYPRMVPGGVILSHDYITAEGPTRAFLEFFADKSEPVIELAANQCVVVATSASTTGASR